jgi:hypothetical protein
MKLWRPKDPKARAVVKLTLWAAVLTWMVFFLAYGVTAAQRFALEAPKLFGTGTWGKILSFIAPIWIIFTAFMLLWAVARFVGRRLRTKKVEKNDRTN